MYRNIKCNNYYRLSVDRKNIQGTMSEDCLIYLEQLHISHSGLLS